jgi:hypothetical protein
MGAYSTLISASHVSPPPALGLLVVNWHVRVAQFCRSHCVASGVRAVFVHGPLAAATAPGTELGLGAGDGEDGPGNVYWNKQL